MERASPHPSRSGRTDPHGHDALVLAPTAGGKTEAAIFPLLSRMAAEDWQGVSVLYVCPLRALLNNFSPASTATARGSVAPQPYGTAMSPKSAPAILAERPDVLLTTPESLESMLVSTKVDPRMLFSGLQAVIVDEIHAFAGDDRGWHLLARARTAVPHRGAPPAAHRAVGHRGQSATSCWPGCRAASHAATRRSSLLTVGPGRRTGRHRGLRGSSPTPPR